MAAVVGDQRKRITTMNELNEPLRLLRQRGNWALEVTKLISIDRHVLRPERRRVNGADSVVRHLKERCAPSLVREALDLIIGDDDGTDRAFELEGEHWIQLHDEASQDRSSASMAQLVSIVGELRAELTTMRALHEAMRGRLATLERRSLQLPPADYGRSQLRAGRRELASPSLRPAPRLRGPGEPSDSPPAPVPHGEGLARELGAAATQAVVAPPPLAELPPLAAAVAKPLMAMPTPADVSTCLKQLLGAEPELRVEKGNLPKDLDAFYVARVVDSDDREMGAILMDLRGGVELGGRMLGFPPAAIEEQAKLEPSPDMLDAMNEVVNNLGGFLNRANPELRTRVRPLEKFSAAEFGWLPQNSRRLGHATKTGGGLWLVTR
jgi:hypothetical protein